jgi:AMP deaminase
LELLEKDSPFPRLFSAGLLVTLSSDDPLIFAASNQALLDEYRCAQTQFVMKKTSLSELANNSVKIAGMRHEEKIQLLGPDYETFDQTSNVEEKSNVPQRRIDFRFETFRRTLAELQNF